MREAMPAAIACHVSRGHSKAQEQDETNVGKMDDVTRAAMAAPNPGQKRLDALAAEIVRFEASEYATGCKIEASLKNDACFVIFLEHSHGA